jgi:hypothetical protein
MNSPITPVKTMSTAPDMATIPAKRVTDKPAVRITTSSLLFASPPSPSSEPINTAIGNISKASCGNLRNVNKSACGVP